MVDSMGQNSVIDHKMNYIFADPDQIETRIKYNYLRGRKITRLVDKIKLNSVDKLIYDSVSGNWLINENKIDLNKRSYFPFCIRRWFHSRKMSSQTKKRRFEEKIAVIRNAYLQESPKKVSYPTQKPDSLVSDPGDDMLTLKKQLDIQEEKIQKANESLQNIQDFQPQINEAQKEIDLRNNYILKLNELKDSINYFGVRIYTSDSEALLVQYLEENIPSAIGKLSTKVSIQEVIQELETQIDLYQEDLDKNLKELGKAKALEEELKGTLDSLNEEKGKLEQTIDTLQEIKEAEDPIVLEELTFVTQLGDLGYEGFYLELGDEEKKIYKTICQPVPGCSLFALAAESFILGMRSIKGKMTQDANNPNRYIVTSTDRKGKCLLETPILSYDKFTFDMPGRMIIEYLSAKQQWKLIKGPKLIFSTFIGRVTIDSDDIGMSTIGGKIKLQYKLPFPFSVFQDEMDQAIINSREDVLCFFKDNKLVVWN